MCFSDEIKSIVNELQSIRNEIGCIQDTYKEENEHSKIISETLKNPDYLNKFVALLKEINRNMIDHKFGMSDLHILTEVSEDGLDGKKRRMDILIYDDEQFAIIIENKIYDAPDQADQLLSYYEIAKDKLNKKIIAIVYLSQDKIPNFNKISKLIYKKYVPEVKELLIHLPFVDNKKDLIFGFLDECAKMNNEKEIEEYSRFLKSKYINEICLEKEKEIFKKLISRDNEIKIINEIVNISHNWYILLQKTIIDILIIDHMFVIGWDNNLYKKVMDNIYIGFGFHFNKNIESCFFGICGKDIENSRTILDKICFNDLHDKLNDKFTECENWNCAKTWIEAREYIIQNNKKVNDIIELIKKIILRIEEEIKK